MGAENLNFWICPEIPAFEKSKLSTVNPLFKVFSDRKVWILFWLSLVKNGNKFIQAELNSNVLLILSQLERCTL